MPPKGIACPCAPGPPFGETSHTVIASCELRGSWEYPIGKVNHSFHLRFVSNDEKSGSICSTFSQCETIYMQSVQVLSKAWNLPIAEWSHKNQSENYDRSASSRTLLQLMYLRFEPMCRRSGLFIKVEKGTGL